MTDIAILTFDGFNELDSFIASALLNRVKGGGWKAHIVTPTETVTSMNGVVVTGQKPLSFANDADVVLFGSGMKTRSLIDDADLMGQLDLDPRRQLIGSQCSGALWLHRLGLWDGPIVTDTMTRPLLEEFGCPVANSPFIAQDTVAAAGGCLASQYLAAWVIARLRGWEEAEAIVHYVAPVGQKDDWVARAKATLAPFV